eukprot:1834936-Pleurochrysis_carterae.AAC.1
MACGAHHEREHAAQMSVSMLRAHEHAHTSVRMHGEVTTREATVSTHANRARGSAQTLCVC